MQPHDELAATYKLFVPIRQRFTSSGVERGGYPRPGLTPVYIRKFGAHAATIFPNLSTVEASFTAEQLAVVMHAILLLKGWMTGAEGQPNLTTRILEHFHHTTHSYFALALLRSTEDLLAGCIKAHPAQAPVFDALFRVAGSEGLRDLIQLYGTRLLNQTLHGESAALPDILGFVNLHQRPPQTGSVTETGEQYEVGCPGHDFAKVFYHHCQAAASHLIKHEALDRIASREMELRSLPIDMVSHFTLFAHQNVAYILTLYGIKV